MIGSRCRTTRTSLTAEIADFRNKIGYMLTTADKVDEVAAQNAAIAAQAQRQAIAQAPKR